MSTQMAQPAFIENVRKQFPILSTSVHGHPLVYLDNAATTQKPLHVIEAIGKYYSGINSNVHRGVHYLSQTATDQFEEARKKVARFIGSASIEQVIFTRGTTESINLVASSFGRKFIGEGDEVIISAMEHHSNIVPWQMICAERKAKLKVIPINDKGELIVEEFQKLVSSKTKLLAIAHVSNALGTINPIKEMIDQAHQVGARVLIDGAQAVGHLPINVTELDCDFYTFSGHKMYGPTGIGILYGKKEILDQMDPWQGGGEMIRHVTFNETTYNDLPFKFEAGTPDIAGAIVLGKAIDFIEETGRVNIQKHEEEILNYATAELQKIPGIRFIGTAEKKTAVISFLLGQHHPYDVGVILDQLGIAIRTGHHCTQPLMEQFGIPGTCRASFAMYNTYEEVDLLVKALLKAKKMLG